MKRIWLRDARKRAGMTQTDLAFRLGRPQSFVSKLETGFRTDITVTQARALGRVLDVDPLALRFGVRPVDQARRAS